MIIPANAAGPKALPAVYTSDIKYSASKDAPPMVYVGRGSGGEPMLLLVLLLMMNMVHLFLLGTWTSRQLGGVLLYNCV